jgi:hypothetical protein
MTNDARRRRLAAFAVVVALAIVAVGVSLWRARPSTPAAATAPDVPLAPAGLTAMPPAPAIAVRHLAPGDGWSALAFAPLGAPDGPRFVTALRCERVHVSGAGRGLCLQAQGLTGRALVFDARQAVQLTVPLTGPPSRARVSRDGRFAAFTVFESGHSYADDTFSTRTTILDLERGTPLPDLETWTARRGTTRVTRQDINYWGVTFVPDGRRFYATLAFGGTPYLVEGDLVSHEMRVLAPEVECPSLSPDGRRLAFKRAEGLRWRLWVRDLGSGAEHVVAGETRSIDDQVEWLDDGRLLYQFPSDDGNNLWVVDVDAAAPAQVFMREAWSPAVVR